MKNVLEQLEGRVLLSTSVSGGVLTITGSDSADRIVITANKKSVLVKEGSHLSRFGKSSHINHIVVNGFGGKDRIKITGRIGATVDGGEGNDLIEGGAGSDLLAGGNGNDRIYGNGGNDSITGDLGRDVMFGGAGDDMLDAYDTQADKVTGGAGNDRARVDVNVDTAWNVEGYQTITSSAGGDPIDVVNSGSMNINTGALNLEGTTLGGIGTLTVGPIISPVYYEGSFQNLNLGQPGTVSGVILNATLQPGSGVDGTIDGGRASIALAGIFTDNGQVVVRQTPAYGLNIDGGVTIEDFINLAGNFNNTVQIMPVSTVPSDQNVTIGAFVDLAVAFSRGTAPDGTQPASDIPQADPVAAEPVADVIA